MLKRVLALVGAVWGGSASLYTLTRGRWAAGTPYAAGQLVGMIVGAIVCVLCLIYLVRGGKPRDKF
jgi:hypothetical protein